MFNFLFKEKPIGSQIEDYLLWRSRRWPKGGTSGHQQILEDFRCTSGCADVAEIGEAEIKQFLDKYYSTYMYQRASKTIHMFIQFHKEQKYARMREMKRKTGFPPNVERIRQIKKMRDERNLSFRAISKMMKRNVSLIHRWYHYDLGRELARSR